MRSSRVVSIATPALALMLTLAGCSGGGDDSAGGADEGSSPKEWAAQNCPLTLSTTDDSATLAMTQGPIVPVPSNMDGDSGMEAMSFYSIDDSTSQVEQVGEMSADTPFCFKGGEETVEAHDPTTEDDAEFYPVSTPENGEVYVNADYFAGGGDSAGYLFDKETKQIGLEGGYDSGSNVEIPADVVDIDKAIDNVADDPVDHCDLIGSECAV
jgi:hypothetical protein